MSKKIKKIPFEQSIPTAELKIVKKVDKTIPVEPLAIAKKDEK
jgi:hypothetical protein